MNRLLITLLLLAGTSLQTLLPGPAWLGSHEWPILLALTLCVALRADRARAVYTGVLAGLLHDAFCPAPLGYSLPFFLLIALGVYAIREEVFGDNILTYTVIGPLAGLLQTVYFSILFAAAGMRPLGAGSLTIRLLGSFLLGALTAPLVYMLLETLPTRRIRKTRWVTG